MRLLPLLLLLYAIPTSDTASFYVKSINNANGEIVVQAVRPVKLKVFADQDAKFLYEHNGEVVSCEVLSVAKTFLLDNGDWMIQHKNWLVCGKEKYLIKNYVFESDNFQVEVTK